ncbi:MAG: hypothetical protein O9340_00035 [Cyclobacteriaceae bacterium]|jgi:hypothetical protein|nr:hypothetical protein [Cyclobacteriaceae bacterium]
MRLELELQYVEFHLDQVEKVGQVDLAQALKIIQSYPWDREFQKIEERTIENLTSTVPSIAIKNKDKETLIISARDKDFFIIEFLTPTHRAEKIIPVNSFDNTQGLTIKDIVERFYKKTAKKDFKLKQITPTKTTEIDVYKLRDYPIFISIFITGLLTLILVLDFWANGLTAKALPAIYFVGLIILTIGFTAIITIHYLINDWGKEVSFESDSIIIKQRGNEIKIKRSDIIEVVIVENENHRNLRYYKYARIRTIDNKAFIVTSLIMQPIDLVNKLKVNHKEESVFLPIVKLNIQSEKEKKRIKLKREKMKIEFLENFKDYEDSKLRQIIGDKRKYADYAIEAANEILEKRKK